MQKSMYSSKQDRTWLYRPLQLFGALACLWLFAIPCAARDVTGGIQTGAEQTRLYFPLLEGKRLAVAGNHSSMIGEVHLVDSLIRSGLHVRHVFSPEHGFRGQAAHGEYVASGPDPKTGLKVISLYGSQRRPLPGHLEDIDLILFDMQDVGARFYTYVSTMTYLMEAAAEAGIPMIILDRPNPNGHFVDGPLLDPAYSSFVGLHPVPVVHGMTLGEYAHMLNGEGWLSGGMPCELTVIPVKNYTHATPYELPLPPSPNLPNMRAVYLYPSLCFFEGTAISLGRGTSHPFQQFGHPLFDPLVFPHQFTPKSLPAAPTPPHEGQLCQGLDLSLADPEEIRKQGRINLAYLLKAYAHFPEQEAFFNAFFDRLAGGTSLRNQIRLGLTEAEIRASWQDDLDAFRSIRRKYLLYPDAD